MNDAKPWQIVVIVLGLLVGVGMGVYSCRSSGIPMASSIMLVDVATGELIDAPFPKGRTVGFPAKNPKTNTMSLYPVRQEGNAWKVEGKYLPYIPGKDPEPKALDIKTGMVTTDGKPKSQKVF